MCKFKIKLIIANVKSARIAVTAAVQFSCSPLIVTPSGSNSTAFSFVPCATPSLLGTSLPDSRASPYPLKADLEDRVGSSTKVVSAFTTQMD